MGVEVINIVWLYIIIPLTLLVGVIYGCFISIKYWRIDCIKRNVARYHPQTGKWEWTIEEIKND